jgi:peptidyl-prolyl cis-trans isomerase A (cyclophilin A)/peptidyl-prolyl cis-trans isomerase B (cyclophilin B)
MQILRRQFVSMVAGVALSCSALIAEAADAPKVSLKTSMGEIVLELNSDAAPKTVENFLAYVKAGHYTNTIFHRVIEGFMIQGGGFDRDMKERKTLRPPVQNEAKNGLKNEPYTIAMARTSDPHSASAQFFINVKDNAMLDYPGRDGWGYAVFGKVVKGMEVVDAIKQVQVDSRGQHQNVPVTPVLIQSATLVK